MDRRNIMVIRIANVFATGLLALLILTTLAAEESLHAQTTPRRMSHAVAISGDYAVVGAHWDNGFKGTAYVLKRDGGTWVEVQALSPADLGRYDHFGSSVTIDGDRIVVGAPWQNMLQGAAYVYKRVGAEWVEEEKLTIGPIGYVSVAGMAAGLSRIVPVAVQAYDARWADGRVEVRWRLIDIEGTISFEVLRAEQNGRFASVNAAPIEESRGEFVFVDEAVEPGVTYWYRVRVLEDGEAITSFETSVRTPVLVASLDQNYPNPFNPATQIRFSIGNPGHVTLGIYDISGRLIRTVVDRPMGAGTFFESWDGRDGRGDLVASGVYFYRLEAGKQVLTRKAVLMR